MPTKNRAGRPTAISQNDRGELRKEHNAFVESWASRLGVGVMTIRRALANTKKGPPDSTGSTP